MKAKRLGRGISAIIHEFPEGIESVHSVNEIATDKIKTNRHQPRKDFQSEAMEELKNSIKVNGLIQPITVRKLDEGFELIAGERRLRASQEIGMEKIPAYILPVKSDVEMMEFALIENVQREDLNPIEESEGYQVLYDTFDLSHEDISKRVGKKRSSITNSLRLLNLPEPIIDDLRSGHIKAGHARPLLNIESEKQQMNLWRRIKDEGLSVRNVEAMVKNLKPQKPGKVTKQGKQVPFAKNIENKIMHIIGTKVKIRGSKAKGKLEIDYYSEDDLNRLIEIFESIEE